MPRPTLSGEELMCFSRSSAGGQPLGGSVRIEVGDVPPVVALVFARLLLLSAALNVQMSGEVPGLVDVAPVLSSGLSSRMSLSTQHSMAASSSA